VEITHSTIKLKAGTRIVVLVTRDELSAGTHGIIMLCIRGPLLRIEASHQTFVRLAQAFGLLKSGFDVVLGELTEIIR
jgi:hypothetical protein